MKNYDTINGIDIKDLPDTTAHKIKEDIIIELTMYLSHDHYAVMHNKRRLDVYVQGLSSAYEESSDDFFNPEGFISNFLLKPGAVINLQSHSMNAYEFEVLEISGIDLVTHDIKVMARLIEDFKLPNEFYMVWKQDSNYDNCFSFHSLSDSLEVAKQTLIDEVGYGYVSHVTPGFVGEWIAFNNRRK